MTWQGPGGVIQPGPGGVIQPGPGGVIRPGPGGVIRPGPGGVIQPGPGDVIQPGPGDALAPAWPTAQAPAWPTAVGAGGYWGLPHAARRQRPYRLLLWLLALAALVAGTTVAVVTAFRVSPPTEAVQGYFAALRAGDAPAALSYGATPSADLSFLSSEVLATQNRLAAIGTVRVDPATVSGRTARVPVTYTLTPAATPARPSIQTTDVALHRHGRGWSLDRTAAVVEVVPTVAGDRVTLAGAAVPAHPVALFPGIVPLRYDTAALRAQVGSGYLTLSSTGTIRVGAQLSESGQATVDATVRAAFRTCLSRPSAATSRSCPLSPTTSQRVVPGSLRGTLRQCAFDGAPVLRDADGLVTTSGLFYVDGRYQRLDFDNVASTARGLVQVNFVVALYVTAPGNVRWELP